MRVRALPSGVFHACRAIGLALVILAGLPATARGQDAPANLSPEQTLAEKYSPIVYIAPQAKDCDKEGEPYLPAPVQISFGDGQVAYRDDEADPSLVKMAPADVDLYQGEESFRLDLPGNARKPGCTYERHARDRLAALPLEDQVPVTHAHIATEEGRDGLAVQYWFYYYFNDWNNLHESDWEMIQVRFDVSTVAEALAAEPVEVAFAQHNGGETADWTDDKLEKEGTHPVVYVSRGSHASYFGQDIFLGFGENGSGFGCDHAASSTERLALQARLIPDTIAGPDDPFAWATFEGRWGEQQPSFWNGPTGPNTKEQWTEPLSWQEDLRGSSIRVAKSPANGPDPAALFCNAVEAGSAFFNFYNLYPGLGYAAFALILGILLWLLLTAGKTLIVTGAIYLRHIEIFAPFGLLVVLLGLVISLIQLPTMSIPAVEFLLRYLDRSPFAGLALAVTFGGVQQLAAFILLSPALIHALTDIRAGRPASVQRSLRESFGNIVPVAIPILRSFAVIFALAISVIGIPWAIRQFARWFFVEQAVVIDGARRGGALERSFDVGRRSRRRILFSAAVLTAVGLGLGPILSLIVFIYTPASLAFATLLSTIMYVATIPFAMIGKTVLYQDLRTHHSSDPAG